MTSSIDNFPNTVISNDPVFFNRKDFAMNTHEERYVIIAGGYGGRGENLSSAAIFDLQTNTCISLPQLPRTGYDEGQVEHGAIIKGYFYIVLMWDLEEDEISDCLDVYPDFFCVYRIQLSNPTAWEKMGEHLIYGNGLIKLVSDGSRLFLFSADERSEPDLIEYDPDKNKFHELSPKQMVVRAAVVIGRKIYVIGEDEEFGLCLEIYDIPSRSWSTGHERSIESKYISYQCHAFALNDRWIAIRDSFSFRSIYDTHNGTWIANEVLFSSSPSFRITGSTLVGNSGLTLVGGIRREANTALYSVERKCIIPNWYIVKDFALLRKLVDDGRAHAIATNEKASIMIQNFVIYLPSDMFKWVLCFL